jgi:iron uptake system component EfeO
MTTTTIAGRNRSKLLALCLLSLPLLACRNAPSADYAQRKAVSEAMKRVLDDQVEVWLGASRELQDAAPLPQGRGWDASADASAISAMKHAWHRARTAYERIEGALAPLFPESDLATDARYDDYLANIGSEGDRTPFDAEGVIGMHAIERILWADQVPADVRAFESGLPGYRPAAFPASEAEARAFKQQLAARLVQDVQKLRAELAPLELDSAFAFQGLIDLAAEQVEKVDRAATGQEESRYAQATLKDLRANRQGCLDAYRVFRPALLARPNGAALDRDVLAAFARLERVYAIPGDAIPRPPASWTRLAPTAEQLRTPFGNMFSAVRRESDDKRPQSLRAELFAVAEALQLPSVVTR